jgi:hypothetical protein
VANGVEATEASGSAAEADPLGDRPIRLSVVVPVFNEETTVGSVLFDLLTLSVEFDR